MHVLVGIYETIVEKCVQPVVAALDRYPLPVILGNFILNHAVQVYLKVPVPKSLENEFPFNWQILSLFQPNIIIHGEKLQIMYLICMQSEKTMFILLIVL